MIKVPEENDQNGEDHMLQSISRFSTAMSEESNRQFRKFNSADTVLSDRQKYPKDNNFSKYPLLFFQQTEKNYLSTKITPHRSNSTRHKTKRRRRADYSSGLDADAEWNDVYVEPSLTIPTTNVTAATPPTDSIQSNIVNRTQTSSPSTNIVGGYDISGNNMTNMSSPTSITTPVVDLARNESSMDVSTHPAVFSTSTNAIVATQTTSNFMYSADEEDETTNQTSFANTTGEVTLYETTPNLVHTTMSTKIEEVRPLPIPPHAIKFFEGFGPVAEYINPR